MSPRGRTAKLLRFGFLGDGCWKLLVAAAYVVWITFFAQGASVSAWLVVMAAVLVAASGAAEIVFALRSAATTHTRYLIAYDSAWVIVTVVAILLVVNGSAAAGPLWFGYQVVAAPLVILVFGSGALRAAV